MFLESSQNWLRDIGSGVIADFYLHTHTAPFVTDGLIYSSFRAVLLKIQLHPTGMAQDTALSEWYGSRYSSIRLIWLKIWIYPSDMAQDTAPSDCYGSRYSFIRVIWLKIHSIRVIWLKLSSFRGIKLKILLHRMDMAQDAAPFAWDGSKYYPYDMTQDTAPFVWYGSS